MENVLVEIGFRHLFQSELVYYLFSRVRRLLEKGESKEQESPLPPSMSKRGRKQPWDHPSRAGITHMVRPGGDEMVSVGDRVGQSPVHISGVVREPSKNESPLGPQYPGVPLWLLVISGS